MKLKSIEECQDNYKSLRQGKVDLENNIVTKVMVEAKN